jgi:hypothetical protein
LLVLDMSEIGKKIKSLIADWKKWHKAHEGKYVIVPCPAQKQIAKLLTNLSYKLKPELGLGPVCENLLAEIEPGPTRFIENKLPDTIQHVEDFIKLLSGGKPELDPDLYYPAKFLAEHYEVSSGALSKRLERNRHKNPGCFQKVPNPGVREARYLYKGKYALKFVETLREGSSKNVF